jgi:hypothetical protein
MTALLSILYHILQISNISLIYIIIYVVIILHIWVPICTFIKSYMYVSMAKQHWATIWRPHKSKQSWDTILGIIQKTSKRIPIKKSDLSENIEVVILYNILYWLVTCTSFNKFNIHHSQITHTQCNQLDT